MTVQSWSENTDKGSFRAAYDGSAGIPTTTVIARKPCDVAICFLLGNMFKTGTLQGERIAAPVCALARNDREIGAWFLKLMTLPPRGKVLGVRS